MDVRARIVEIEAEARRHGVPIAELCRRARVAQSSWQRWRGGMQAWARTWDRVEEAAAAIGRPDRASIGATSTLTADREHGIHAPMEPAR